MPERAEQKARGEDVAEFSAYVQTIVRRSLLVLLVALAVAWPLDGHVGRGLALGGMFSLLRLRLRANRLLRLGSENAVRKALAHSLVLYLAAGAVLVAAAAHPRINLYAAVAGLFLTNLVIVAERVVPAWRTFDNPKTGKAL